MSGFQGKKNEKKLISLDEITKELNKITDLANAGKAYDENRMDYLLSIRETHPEYLEQLDQEREEWLQSIEQFIYQCQERVRTFVPVDIFSTSYEALIELGLTTEVAKRVMQKQCLWLVRMSTAEIARLHEADLYGRYNSIGQGLDIIETAAVFASLPDEFCNDTKGKKLEWKNVIENNLKTMLQDNEKDSLPANKIRAMAYNSLQYGPIRDISTVREYKVMATSEGMYNHKSDMEELFGTQNVDDDDEDDDDDDDEDNDDEEEEEGEEEEDTNKIQTEKAKDNNATITQEGTS